MLIVTAPANALEIEPVSPLLAGADPTAGEALFNRPGQCMTCHTVAEGGPNRVGPNLWNIVDQPKAAREGFRYSRALESLDGVWTYERINSYIANPRAFARGTRMAFVGVRNAEDRAAIIAYLRTLSADPAPLPE